MRSVIVAANWKMNVAPADAAALATAIAAVTAEPSVERVIFPTYVALDAVGRALAGTGIAVGAQNCHHEPSGAYTGEIAAGMLRDLATWVLLGHSERRRDQGETDELVGRKLVRAAEAGLRPVVCVGESLADREAGRADAAIAAQVEGALGVALRAGPLPEGLVIAYEPVWAIGTGKVARGADAAAIAATIRAAVAGVTSATSAASVPIVYGGSVTSASCAEYLGEPEIDGVLVGGAGLKPDEMAAIVGRAAVTARARGAA